MDKYCSNLLLEQYKSKNGLFVTLSNYTNKVQKYLDNTSIIRGINDKELVDLILKYYDSLSEKYRKMIPLKMVYKRNRINGFSAKESFNDEKNIIK